MIIAFSGRMGSGKSTAIEILKATHSVRLRKFAGTLYEMQDALYGMVASAYERPADFVKDRKLLQWLGTEWGRGLDENLWVNIWKHKVAEAQQDFQWANDGMVDNVSGKTALFVADDCRFDNEAEAVRAMGGKVIQIIRPNSEVHAEGGVGIKAHASEAGLKPELVDYVIENKGTLDEFRGTLRQHFAKMLPR